jgi:hypothetical protein
MGQKEIWKDIEGYGGVYQVSNLGGVRSSKGGVNIALKPAIPKRGYMFVVLDGRLHYIHRLVATAFIPNRFPEERTEINHRDGRKRNNRVKNLEWVSRSENIKHAYDTGLRVGKYAKRLTETQKNDILHAYIGIYNYGIEEIAEIHGVDTQTILNLLQQKPS